MRCPSCRAENPAASRFCNRCGADLEEAPTVTHAPARPPSSSSSSSEEGRFPAGTLLAGRYRIVGLLGRGGMGEVYRASDLKLNQPVALKFLPEAMARDERLLARFHGEVRLARQISHANVCRVYDIGELDGTPYISMEYVDGEDLGVLLRRIGRLPGDKAVEIARRLCAGLGAAHARGVLHRDLKPANIMIDGQGQVRVMDFGLAALAGEVQGGDVRSGTPAYMAPEQKDGREVTARSDIYSLGLVLHEIVTGRKPGGSGSPIKDVDPAMEKVIQRCLDPDPARRPATAFDVARALPGGDPLAEALAAGETPSPEMVAASEDTGALSVRSTVACFVFVLVALVAAVILKDRTSVLRVIPMPNSPEVLAQKARDLVVRFGYTDPPQDEAFFFTTDTAYRAYAAANWTPEQYRSRLASGWPRLIGFAYRQSPRYLNPINAAGIVTVDDPPPVVSGMIHVELDPRGRLYHFTAVPPQVEEPGSRSFEWSELFSAAGLDQSRFQPAEPQWIPLVGFDARAAWTGTLEGAPPVAVRLEAASWKGRPVYFQMVRPWQRPAREQAAPVTTRQRITQWLVLGLVSAVFLSAGLLAWRHYRSQRGDLRGSARLAAFTAVCSLLEWFLTTHHLPTTAEFAGFVDAISTSAYRALLIGGLYMALEPYVRRRWPQSMIAWGRLLAGGVRDPLVGGHVLVGTALGLAAFLVIGTIVQVREAQFVANSATLRGAGVAAGRALSLLTEVPLITLFVFFLFFLLRVALRRDLVAAAVVVVLGASLVNPPDLFARGAFALVFASGIWVLLRFGVLPLAAAVFVAVMMDSLSVTSDFSAWYSGAAFVALGTVLASAVWSFRAALGGRTVWKEDILEG